MGEIEVTGEFSTWYAGLNEPEYSAVNVAVDKLREGGPSLRRPLVGHVEQSARQNMRELVVPYGNLRVLFAFDPRRTAILLLGGDKTGRWKNGTTRMYRTPTGCTPRKWQSCERRGYYERLQQVE